MSISKIIIKIIVGACISVTTGVILSLFFSYIRGTEYFMAPPSFINRFPNTVVATSVCVLCFVLMGIFISIGSVGFYERNKESRFSLATRSVLHFLSTFLIVGGFGTYMHWFKGGIEMFGFLVVFLVIYIIIWLINFFYIKSKIDEINKHIQNL